MSNKSFHSQNSKESSLDSFSKTSGLIKAVGNTGRVRGSSATPAPQVISPIPRRKMQSIIDNMNNMSIGQDRTENYSERSNNSRNISPTASTHSPRGSVLRSRRSLNTNLNSSKNHSKTSSFNTDTGRMNPNVPSFQSSYSQGQLSSNTSLVLQNESKVSMYSWAFQAKLNDLIIKIEGSEHINPTYQDTLIKDVQALTQQYNDQQRQLQQEFDRVAGEKDHYLHQLSNAAENVRKAYADRNRFGKERDNLRRSHEDLKLKAQKSTERLNELVQHWVNKNVAMMKEVERKNAQLEEKHSLQTPGNAGPSPRIPTVGRSGGRDPFTSPSTLATTFENFTRGSVGSNRSKNIRTLSVSSPTEITALIGTGFGQSSALGFVHPDSGPPNTTVDQLIVSKTQAARRRPNPNLLPTGPAPAGRPLIPESPWDSKSSRAYNTEPGDTPCSSEDSSMALALVLHTNVNDPSPVYQQEFSDLYVMVEGWVQSYCHLPNLENDRAVARTNQTLWSFMMNCTYPGQRQDSHTHVMTLLNDTSARSWFVMRMGVSYIMDEILSFAPYKLFSADVDAQLEAVKLKIAERGLANEARQALVDQRAKAIQGIVSSPNWAAFRKASLAIHSKRLRDILGPMLNDYSLRSTAGSDLGAVILKAWDLSVNMNTSQLTFQIYFPETAQKFNASTMIAKDKKYIDPMALQIKQARLKLVITPVVTMRDDRGTTIRAKNLHKSTVLTMG
ncbi:hypothetical protein QTJ16_000098 [Diplocarpon rosae]|uniref:Uncharacterized protein n=1 Tax=Diplocarpon rosae TaxID=946125 RepID=A0AAD9T5L5_9HELO|nr:hypothetical protein QTJ16_000098 [Diplocarpon rosae]PBP17231.1 hypothetical protein BUE80_DR012092 [Diplocarpon rosae]